jgi:hypothetical protein
MRKINSKLVVVMLAVAVAMPMAAFAQSSNPPPASSAQVPQPPSGGVDWNGVGIGAATLGANVLYIPAKFVYGILGGITGGAGWAVTGGNSQVSDTIWRSSLGGDYVLTPSMIRGDDPIHFSGPTTTAPGGTSAAGTTAPVASSATGTTAGGSASSGYSSSAGSAPMSVVPSNSTASGQPIDNGSGPVRGAATANAPHQRDFE